ncbi:AAA family ATPase [Commensalibacter nepenthis]|uniref:AAA family ATPase n=1 Tax=Commensalibacter nepenthis TaxID=3043872 RepID=A0ABT6Q8C4_9PROT|nr:AAA family ATPase [Commensalibacter sp. TBRC 10068]MDI2113039.1 AAA family ATPase [Commensalibacter sp. TBRC 10068]
MSFTLQPAVRQKINLLFAIAGASGSGKTYSALLLAQGIAGDNGKIAVIDTEAGRSLQYAPKNGEQADHNKGTFNFLHLDFVPPFTPERYIEAIQTCEQAGASVIVIDSASHEWNGEGGIVEMSDGIALRKATDNQTGEINFKKLEAVKMLSWAEPKKQHKKMMAKLTQVRSHIIFCLRAEEKVKPIKNHKGFTEVVNQGFQPICEKGFMFEMTASLTLEPTNPGKPNYELDKKLNRDMQVIFQNGQLISVEHGKRLKEWSESGCDIEPKKSQLEQNYERLANTLSQVKDRTQLEKITGHKATINLRKELVEKEPIWAGIIDDLIEQALREFDNEEAQADV